MTTKSAKARYPKVRRAFGTLEEIGEIINRSRTYVAVRMIDGGPDFTRREKLMIAEYLGKPAEDVPQYFPDEEKEEYG